MSLSSVHPEYAEFLGSWALMRDAYKGEKAVKDKGIAYLPPTSGMVADGMQTGGHGAAVYDAYKKRAYFPDIVAEAVHAMLGVMHNHPPEFHMPEKMSGMIENATDNGESLAMLLRKINEQQIIAGRLGLLVDFDSNIKVGELPYIAMYRAEAIKNWDTATITLGREHLNLVILDESGVVRDADFTWTQKDRYRVLILGDLSDNEYVGEAPYRFGVYQEEGFTEDSLVVPRLVGRQLNEIPFTFINSRDISAQPEEPPLLGLARLAMLIYRSEADYRQSLFLQGQDTLVVVGSATDTDALVRVGANGILSLPVGADAKFIGVSSTGLPEQRIALENLYNSATARGAKMLDGGVSSRESGEALRIRIAAKTATLNEVALAGAFGLQSALRHVAKWMGLDPEAVRVVPNTDFSSSDLSGDDLVKIMTAKGLGAPISHKAIHALMKEKGLTGFDYEQELEEIEEEAQNLPQNLVVGGYEDLDGATPQENRFTQSSDGPERREDDE